MMKKIFLSIVSVFIVAGLVYGASTLVQRFPSGTPVEVVVPGGDGSVPSGGTTGQVLTKDSNTNYDISWATGSGGSPTDADYLVGTANGSLSAEIVVGTSPGGELGGTWASPTIDDLFIKNDASDTMTGTLTADGLTIGNDELITFGSETFSFVTAGSVNDFNLSDDLNINDSTPHLGLIDSDGDDFEIYADGNRFVLTNITDGLDIFYVNTDNTIALLRDATVPTETYDATGWNGDYTIPTKDAIRDKIEALPGGHAAVTVTDTATLDLTLATQDIKGDVITLKDLVTTAPLTGGTNDILVGADSDITIAMPQATTSADGYVVQADWDSWTDHVADNTQAHSDYVVNSGDTITGAVTINDNGGTGSTLLTIGDANDADSAQIYGDLTVTGGDITLGTSSIFSGGDTTSLNNIDAIDATTETTLESALDIGGEVTSTGMGSTVIADSLAVTSWNLTTPTLTTSATVTDGFTLGLGTGKGLIQFDDETTDYISFSNAKVGIGTTTPWQELTVVGDATLSDDTANLVFRDSDDNTAYQWHLDSAAATAPWNNFALWRGTDSGTGFGVNPSVPLMYFDNNNDTHFSGTLLSQSGTTGIKIKDSGYVGINNTAPAASLDVSQSGAKTVVDYGTKIANTSTSSTANINKYGLYVSSTGNWTGTGVWGNAANNYGLFIAAPTGASSRNIYNANIGLAVQQGGFCVNDIYTYGFDFYVGNYGGKDTASFFDNATNGKDTYFTFQARAAAPGIVQTQIKQEGATGLFKMGTALYGSGITPTLTMDINQNLGIGNVTPDYRLEIYDATNTPALALSDDDIAHGVTTLTQTDTFGHLTSISSTVGGLQVTGLADATGTALGLKGVQSSDPTDTTPAVSIIGTKASGTGVVDLLAAETVLQVANNDDAAAITVLGNGYVGINKVTPGEELVVGGDIDVEDATPHFRYTDTTGSEDDFETYADGSKWVASNITDGLDIFGIASDNTFWARSPSFSGTTTISGALVHTQTKCAVVENLAAADDNMSLGMPGAVTITGVACSYVGTGTTPATITLEDGSGNAMTITGTNPTCVAHGTNATFAAVTASNTLVSGEILRFDVTNAVSPETDEYSICYQYTE